MTRTCMRAAAVSLALVASSLPAQGISWGPVAGLNMSTFGGADATDASNKIGLVAGLAVEKGMEGKALFFRSGVAYSQQGSKIKDPTATLTFKLNYISIPVLVGFKLNTSNPKMTPYIVGGAQLGLKAGCDVEVESSGSSASFACDDPSFTAEIKAFDVALAVGGGVAMAAGRGSVHLGALYALGLSSIDDSAAATDIKNQGFSFLMSYMMPIGKKK